VVSFTSRPLYPQGKSPWYPLDRRPGGPQSHSGHGGEEKNSQPLPGIEPQNPNHPAHSPVLYQLSYHGSLNLIISYKNVDFNMEISSVKTKIVVFQGRVNIYCKIFIYSKLLYKFFIYFIVIFLVKIEEH
jgi:hypothetical protein